MERFAVPISGATRRGGIGVVLWERGGVGEGERGWFESMREAEG
jgi:hypothetical protein